MTSSRGTGPSPDPREIVFKYALRKRPTLQQVEELEKEFQKKIVIKADPNLHQEQYEVVMV